MNARRDPDRLIHAFLLEGEETMGDQVYDAVRAEIEQTRQRAFIGPWRMPTMNKIVGLGLAAAAVVVAVLIGAQFLGSPSGNVGGPGGDATATPVPEPTPTSEPSAAAPTSSADAFLPEGPFLVWDPLVSDPPFEGAPSVTMTIPASGWAYLDFQALIKGEEVDNLPEVSVIPGSLPPGTGYYVYGDPCQWASTKPETPATTVDEVIAALGAQASRDASEPVDVTVGGYAGKMITLHVPEDADFGECDGRKFASYEGPDVPGMPDGPWQWHQGPGQIDDFWFIDVEGSLVEIRALYRSDTPTELVAEMRTLVESSTFEFP